MPPLELIASVLGRFREHSVSTKQLFDVYDRFIGMLLDEDVRNHLERLHSDECASDVLYQQARSLRREFQDSLSEIFLEKTSILGQFTIRYGVF
jgi:predicted RecB family nuclease